MEFRNGILLQLIECIESTQNEVKRKMIKADALQRCTKSSARLAREKKVRANQQLSLMRALLARRFCQLRFIKSARLGDASLCETFRHR